MSLWLVFCVFGQFVQVLNCFFFEFGLVVFLFCFLSASYFLFL